MRQSNILRHCYDSVFTILKREGETSNLFTVEESGFDNNQKSEKAKVFMSVSDIAQISQDKNGEKVFIDEEQFPAPTYLAFILAINISAEKYQDILETCGYIVHYFKDNNFFEAGVYNWHGNTNKNMYIEGIIRKPDINRTVNHQYLPLVTLEYRIEAAINSKKGEKFKRVEEREIRGNQIH
jgi:hypothetical protein